MSLSYVVDGETDLDSALFNPIIDRVNGDAGPLANMRAGVANVLDEGADSSGTNDSTNAFKNAIATGKPLIYAPYGSYLLDPDQIKIPGGVTLFGDGYDTELKQADGTTGTLLGTSATSNANPAIGVGIRDLRINGNKGNQSGISTQYGIALHYTRKAMISGVYVHDTVRTAIYLAGSRARVLNCEVWDIGLSGGSIVGMSGIVGDHNASASDAPYEYIVSGNRIVGVLEHGIKLYQGCDRSVIDGNVVNDTGDKGIWGWEGDDLSITGNTVKDAYAMGILVWGDGSTSAGAAVSGNTVDGSESQWGIHINAYLDAAVAGNHVRGALRGGIGVEGSTGYAVSGNTVVSNGKSATDGMLGIAVSSSNGSVVGNVAKNNGLAVGGTASVGIQVAGATTTDVVISGNRCYDDQGTATQEYGIRVRDGADYITLIGNNCRGNGASGYELSGAGANIVNEHNL